MSDRLFIHDSVSSIKGIGGKKQQILESAGIFTVDDLLSYYPVRYKDRRSLLPVSRVPEGRDSLVCGELVRVTMRPLSGHRTLTECTMRDESGVFLAVFFNMPYLRKSLKTGARYVMFGQMRPRSGMKVWTNPEMTLLGGERDVRGIVPVYRTIQGIGAGSLGQWIRTAIETADIEDDWIGSRILLDRKLCGRGFAIRNIHFPESEQHYKAARYRIIYEQLLTYQLAVRMSRQQAVSHAGDASIEDADIAEFIERLPFELTEGQRKCISEIESDLTSPDPMNRLVQGDVGCGKTVVAEAAMFKCVRAGHQAAMMAPTEILARQHHARLREDMEPLGIRTGLLISGMKAAERRELLRDIESGSIDIVVGTHAVIQKDVEFRDLALVITDEQHRFGVNQRRRLTEKGSAVNVLVMSATPIPRTLAATVFGDMDFSIIRTRPEGRREIITRALDKTGRERAYRAVGDELDKGKLAYIVAPSIDSEDDDLSSVMKLFEEVKRKYPGYRTELLHGRMSKEEKESIMDDFNAHRIHILVATVVVEVGIDVSDATIIVIENCERFGLAQLHQLRGRVGRSSSQSYCYLINYSSSETAAARARAMTEISDGFEISEVDYEMRGPGDVMGTMQSGNYQRDILALSRYTDILEAAMEDADTIMKSPELADLSHVEDFIEASAASDNSGIL